MTMTGLYADEDKENQTEDNLPDNSNLQCNLCITGLDPCLLSEDLHIMFSKFGEIKSAKISTEPLSGDSRCYGFVWFTNEKSCSAALEDAANLPYHV